MPSFDLKSSSYVGKKHLAINIIDDEYQETHNYLENHDLYEEKSKV